MCVCFLQAVRGASWMPRSSFELHGAHFRKRRGRRLALQERPTVLPLGRLRPIESVQPDVCQGRLVGARVRVKGNSGVIVYISMSQRHL